MVRWLEFITPFKISNPLLTLPNKVSYTWFGESQNHKHMQIKQLKKSIPHSENKLHACAWQIFIEIKIEKYIHFIVPSEPCSADVKSI